MSKIFGAIYLILGITIGAGILALPIVTVNTGFYWAAITLIVVWAIVIISSFYILEICLWFPKEAHFSTIVDHYHCLSHRLCWCVR